MKYCPNPDCRKSIPDSAEHCPYCGQNMVKTKIPATPFYVAGIAFLAIAVILFIQTIPGRGDSGSIPGNPTSTGGAKPLSQQPSATPTTRPIVPTFTTTPKYPETEANPGSCPEAPPPRIFINALVKVTTTNNDRLVLRSSPVINDSNELQRLNKGAELKVHDGPVCVTDPSTGTKYWFWEVKVKSNKQIGWVAEGDRLLYYLDVVH